ncbi:type II toxin-antitoxin system RelE/ParE family toxin [Janthinobacterium sp.]|uniref:type II toxin-antitoxin system RelE family toxin n=1 Tax=Janthinobacterium sp. TaxID=1871054 RepID=UPI0026298D6D|nr:type II toxin-antitoxin system RelE/ParE family toxin [Janthinobacterium sp.]
MLKLAISKSAERFLASLDAKQYRQVGQSMFNLLSTPIPHDSSPLKGATNGDRRVDVGEYRIIYVLVGDTLEVLVIGKRNGDEVYKIWERMK